MSLVVDFSTGGRSYLGKTTPPFGDGPQDDKPHPLIQKRKDSDDIVKFLRELIYVNGPTPWADIPPMILRKCRYHLTINPMPGCNPDFDSLDWYDKNKIVPWFDKLFQRLRKKYLKSFIYVYENDNANKKVHFHILLGFRHDEKTFIDDFKEKIKEKVVDKTQFTDSQYKKINCYFKLIDTRGRINKDGLGGMIPYKDYLYTTYFRKETHNREKCHSYFINKL